MKKLLVLLSVVLSFPLLLNASFAGLTELITDGRIYIKNEKDTPLNLSFLIIDGPSTKYPDYAIAAGETFRIPEFAGHISRVYYKRPPFLWTGNLPAPTPEEVQLSQAMDKAKGLARSSKKNVTLVFSNDKPVVVTQEEQKREK